jgi:hypothetical protein
MGCAGGDALRQNLLLATGSPNVSPHGILSRMSRKDSQCGAYCCSQ